VSGPGPAAPPPSYHRPMVSMLELVADLPVVTVMPGTAVIEEGGTSGPIWVLIDGALEVRKGSVTLATINEPGAVIGEMAVLLGGAASATVVATAPCRLHVAQDGEALFAADPRVTSLVARGLAERLHFMSAYLADLKHHYGDAPGLAMVDDVLAELASRPRVPMRPGSARDPDPEY
jgi:CRP/FNR family cyclic AMP-dependent transcriptional regulator